MTSVEIEASTSHVPAFAKFVMVVQTFVILYFVVWSYEEYLNNQYFQNYVNNTLQGGVFGIIAISTVGIFSAVASGLYMKLRNTRKELEHEISSETKQEGAQGAGSSVLAPHVEQHLINMIRNSTPSDTTSSSALPVLKREDQPSGRAK